MSEIKLGIPDVKSIDLKGKAKEKLGLDAKLSGKTDTQIQEEASGSPIFELFSEATIEKLMSEGSTLATKTIEVATRYSGYGAPNSSLYTIINGMNITGGKPMIPMNLDHHGYTFFTKPQLNLSYDNVITVRRLTAYADQRPKNMANAIRCMLQPYGMCRPPATGKRKVNYDIGLPNDNLLLDVRSDVVDDFNCFIPLLSNTLLTFSGLPDLNLDTYTSKQGISKEQVSWVDDRPYQRSTFSINLSFQNMDGNVLTHFFHVWLEYAARVAEGTMLPFPYNVMNRRIDYQTRIYRIITDRTKRYVQGIASTIAFPTAYPLGRNFDFNANEKLNLDSKEINIPFQCIGVEYDDPILIHEFNKLVSRFNPRMKADAKYAQTAKPGVPPHRVGMPIPDPAFMVEVPEQLKPLFNYKVYPYISPSNEILWYTYRHIYDKLTKY